MVGVGGVCSDWRCGLSFTFSSGRGVYVLFVVGKCYAGSVDPVFARDAQDTALLFFVVVNALGADETLVNFWWSRVALNVSG